MSGTNTDATTNMPAARSTTESAVYSQTRRDNEKQARDELRQRVFNYQHTPLLSNRGDLTPTAQLLASALLKIDSTATLPSPKQRSDHNTSKYSLLRRKNERDICDKLENLISHEFLSQRFIRQGGLSRATKIVLATTRYLDHMNSSNLPQISSVIRDTMPRKRKFVDSDEESDNSEDDIATQLVLSSDNNTTLVVQNPGSRSSISTAQPESDAGRVLRSASWADVTVMTGATQVSHSEPRYPKRGTFSTLSHELYQKSPPIPSTLQKAVEVQAMFRDYNRRPDDEDAPLRPDGRKRKRTMQQMVDEITDDEATEPELCQQLEGVADRLMRIARGLSTPEYRDVEADMEKGKILSVGSTRTVVSDPRKELIWVIELMIDAAKVVRHIKGSDRIIEQWNGRREAWIREGMLVEDVD